MEQTRWPTIGVLAGWQVYWTATPLSFLDPLLRGIRAAAHDRKCNLLLACGIGPPSSSLGETRPAWPIPSPGTDFVPVGPWNTDGLIVVNPLLSEDRSSYIHGLIATGHPVVFVGKAEGGPAVDIDNETGIREAMAHLAAHGHRRIAFIAGHPDDPEGDSGDRLKAYRDCLQVLGLEADPALVAHGFHVVEGGQQAVRHILDAGTSFTAILTSNDESALGAMQALDAAGLHIPGDVALVGFDDRPETLVQEPSLTSVHAPTFERGYRALEVLLAHIADPGTASDIIRVPTRLVIRESCGCQPGSRIPIDRFASIEAQAGPASSASQIAQGVAEAMLAQAQYMTADSIHALCRRLVEAFTASLETRDPRAFHATLAQLLRQVEAAGDDTHMWQSAVLTLQSLEEAPRLLTHHCRMTPQQIDDMLHLAQTIVSDSVQRQYRRHVVDQRNTADQIGLLTSRLLTALDETQIYATLAEHLPQLGIRHAGVAFYTAEGDDPTAWSSLRIIPGSENTPRSFPTRQFPPPGAYLRDEPFSLVVLPLKIEERLAGFVAFDATNLELYATIIRQLAAALKGAWLYQEATEARQLAEEANRLKSRFLSTVSHELRTPLNLIVGLSEMLLHEKEAGSALPQAYHHDLERIHASAQHLDGLIRDVLDLARSETGQLRLTCEPLDLGQVLKVASAVGEQLARDKGLDWHVEIPDGLPPVWGDRTRLRQVVLNLVSNAVKFTSRGEIMLRVEKGDDRITVSVCDTGLGIPPGEQEVIFDEFRQSQRTTARGYGGLGLGLAICKRLVELHGGEIGARSSGEEGAGSTFFFTLPIKAGPPGHPYAAEEAWAREQTVLLLAEHSASGEHLRQHLTQQGFAAEALWVDEAIDWLPRLLASPPGALALDMELASEQGWDILKTLKGNPATQDIPVLFYSLAEDGGSVLELDYLTKPVGSAELARALKQQDVQGSAGEKVILVVDDEPGILEIHARIVQEQSASYRVLRARDGREALEIMRQDQPDLVLLDLMMPELDGFGVLEKMRSEATLHDIPVIVLTGQVLTEEDMARLNQGVAAVLGKGLFSVEETLAHIEETLSRERKLGSETQRLVRKAMAYIHEHYRDPIAREEVARHIGVNKDYLTHRFSQETGVSLVAYLNRYRINRARALLEAGQKNVTEIAGEVGFSDSNYFSRMFRKEVGMSPNAYRRARGKR